MLRRRCGVVMDEEYVQEHTLTNSVDTLVGDTSPTHSQPLTAILLRELFCQSKGQRRISKKVPAMLRKAMIVLAKTAALTNGMIVKPSAHGRQQRAMGRLWRWRLHGRL